MVPAEWPESSTPVANAACNFCGHFVPTVQREIGLQLCGA